MEKKYRRINGYLSVICSRRIFRDVLRETAARVNAHEWHRRSAANFSLSITAVLFKWYPMSREFRSVTLFNLLSKSSEWRAAPFSSCFNLSKLASGAPSVCYSAFGRLKFPSKCQRPGGKGIRTPRWFPTANKSQKHFREIILPSFLPVLAWHARLSSSRPLRESGLRGRLRIPGFRGRVEATTCRNSTFNEDDDERKFVVVWGNWSSKILYIGRYNGWGLLAWIAETLLWTPLDRVNRCCANNILVKASKRSLEVYEPKK